MVVKASIDTPLCDQKHEVTVNKIEDSVEITIETSCENIGEKINLTKMELLKPDTYHKKMKKFMRPGSIRHCFIPTIIANLAEAEIGLDTKSRLDKITNTEIKIKENK
ncbi:MAG: hypothetical protein BTN85_1321 [Candidatus Methanohalarchaeum thermophilum]|uniref:Uncharacterized protein n=1 Tax=Methanohalarchaeum thermophilum TaxID=1903181 RepID=A0A1Q6DWX1_METT1|nr:MAG: hypothetical protein BTN85_1321 [Candidatus Methanohalarchaeum thermophilum]